MVIPVAMVQQAGDLLLGDVHAVRAADFHVHRTQIAVAGEALHRRGIGNKNAVILVGSAHAGAFAFQQANDGERNVFDPHALADRVQRAEQFVGRF